MGYRLHHAPQPSGQTRARVRARDLAEIEAGRVTVSGAALRTPRVMVEVRLGAVGVRLLVYRRRRGQWGIRWPTADGVEGITLRPTMQEAAEAAARRAVEAHPAALHYLREGWRSGRDG